MNTKMKLSEAIREGSKKRPQYHGAYFYDGRSCTLGAAYEGRTGKTLLGCSVSFHGIHPTLSMILRSNCPQYGCSYCGLRIGSIVVHLNDFHKWSREAISEWIATIEDQLESSAPEQVESVIEEEVCVY